MSTKKSDIYSERKNLAKSNKEISNKNKKLKDPNQIEKVKPNWNQILVASAVSGIVSAIITNPIDAYQINKQVNPTFNIKELNRYNIFVGVKTRIYLLVCANMLTFVFLESIGPNYFNICLEDE